MVNTFLGNQCYWRLTHNYQQLKFRVYRCRQSEGTHNHIQEERMTQKGDNQQGVVSRADFTILQYSSEGSAIS